MSEDLCHHIGSVCDESCDCHCDTCTEQYAINWAEYTKRNDLCDACGMPNTIGIDAMFATRYTHFYQPCSHCRPKYLEFMSTNNLCVQCQGQLVEDKCTGCHCTRENTCECRQCKQHVSKTLAPIKIPPK